LVSSTSSGNVVTSRDVPTGYDRVMVRGIQLVARSEVSPDLQSALADGSLYEYAARQPGARALAGRAVAYAVALPSGERVVVRHNRHGGLLARVTGDVFLPPTRAPLELTIALRLSRAGVSTPDLLGYAIYPAGPVLRRSDVVTREIANARDLATELQSHGDETRRRAVLDSTTELIRSLVRAGAVHHDLNLKNILIVDGATRPSALVLDVDRVEFRSASTPEVAAANLRRFLRSARKWQHLHQLHFLPGELDRLGLEVLAR
jgi:hypothetical protein